MTTPNFKLSDYLNPRPTSPMDVNLYLLAIVCVLAALILWFGDNERGAKILAAMAAVNVIVVCIKDPRQERLVRSTLSRVKHNATVQQKREERLRRRKQ